MIRRSIAERMAELNSLKRPASARLAASEIDDETEYSYRSRANDDTQLSAPRSVPDATMLSFRVHETGEVGPVDFPPDLHEAPVLQPLPPNATDFHLLCVPGNINEDDIEELAISVWDEAGWIGSGVLHLTEGALMRGPWSFDAAFGKKLGIPDGLTTAWMLQVPMSRRDAPGRGRSMANDWTVAFPTGFPNGVELKTLLVMRKMARRLHGALRVTGSGHIFAPEAGSAVNLRVYSPSYLESWQLASLLEGQPLPAPESTVANSPHAVVIGEAMSQIIAGVRPVDQVPRSLRLQDWLRRPVNVYELTWVGGMQQEGRTMTRSVRRVRDNAKLSIAEAAIKLANALGEVAIIDEDDFLVDPYELIPTGELQHL